MNCAVIVAGGSGTRMGGPVAKQYLPLSGIPILARTVARFGACPDVHRIVVVVPKADLETCRRDILPLAGADREIRLAAGGAERQDSVYQGLLAAGPDVDLVAVHDAVRPLVTPEEISRCLALAGEHGACILAAPAADTLKRADAEGRIRETLDRTHVWLAQTPQAFRYTLLLDAHERARREGFIATDDAALAERLGLPVYITPGSARNLKITTPADLALAEAILAAGEAKS